MCNTPPPRDAAAAAAAAALPAELPCPLCDTPLRRDQFWRSPHWVCANAHSYSNVQVLLADLADRGWRPPAAGGQPAA